MLDFCINMTCSWLFIRYILLLLFILWPSASVTAQNTAKKIDAIIVPGTKWCGNGNVAMTYDDLGIFMETDKCCRAHDSCPYHIFNGETKYSLTNDLPFTISDCVCDEDFRKCLEDIGNIISSLVKTGFFQILPTKCFNIVDGKGEWADETPLAGMLPPNTTYDADKVVEDRNVVLTILN